MLDPAAKLSILIVDDEPDFLESLEQMFLFLGWTVHTAHFAHRALEIVQEAQPSIALVDVHLGDMSGTEFVRHIRASGFDLPVMLMTGKPSKAILAEAIATKVDAYITKPFRAVQVIERAHDIVEQRHAAA